MPESQEKVEHGIDRDALTRLGGDAWQLVCGSLDVEKGRDAMPLLAFVWDFDSLDAHFYNEVGAYVLPDEEERMKMPGSDGLGYVLLNEKAENLNGDDPERLERRARSTLVHESIHILRYRYGESNGDAKALAAIGKYAAGTDEPAKKEYARALAAHLEGDESLARAATALIEGWPKDALLAAAEHLGGLAEGEPDPVQKTYYGSAATGYRAAAYVSASMKEAEREGLIRRLLKKTPCAKVGKELRGYASSSDQPPPKGPQKKGRQR
jgi:hypothetical protein